MGNSIVFISKPTIFRSTLPQIKPANFSGKFSYEISKPVNAMHTSLMIETSFTIESTGSLKTSFGVTTHSVCEIETKHTESENYILLHRAMKIVVDNFREVFTSLNVEGYTNDITKLFPYPKYEIVSPILREIYNPLTGLNVN